LFDLLDDDADDDAVDTLAIRVNSSGVGGLSHSQSQGTFRSAIHQFMPENMPKFMPAVLSMKIMTAFSFVLHCVLALFSCQHIWYSPNYHKIMPGCT
jgi:hypothetical protein